MITESTILIDDFEDEILTILEPFNARKRWDKTKHALRHEFVSLLEAKEYISFWSGPTRYLVSRIGSSYLYDVPLYKRGNLSKFRGKRVRIVCTHTGNHSWRKYMVGIVGDSPSEKIVRKLSYVYSFPEYVRGQKVLYKSRRFLVAQANKDLIILSNEEPNGYIDLAGWDSILVDGKKSKPVATLNHSVDGTVRGKRRGGYWHEGVYSTLKEAVDDLKY